MSQVLDLDVLGDGYDQPPPADGRSQLLFVCSTPRTGSHRLSRALYDLGLGIPEEYFHPAAIDQLGQRWQIPGDRMSEAWLAAYWDRLRRHRTRNGVLAVSMFGFQISTLARLLTPGDQPVWLHLYRRNVADQIASLLALYQTKMPYDHPQRVAEIPDIAEISPRAIRILHQWITLQNGKWCKFLADRPHLSIASEDFFARPTATLRNILGRGGWTIAAGRVAEVGDMVTRSGAYPVNADIKRQLMTKHAAAFAAIVNGC